MLSPAQSRLLDLRNQPHGQPAATSAALEEIMESVNEKDSVVVNGQGACYFCGIQTSDHVYDDDDPSVGYRGQVHVCHDCYEEQERKENRARGYS